MNRARTDALLLIAFCGFLFFYGLGSFGLLGADEPRYAQVAREMFERHDWITPTLQGKPWLEKPPLYYWQAMVSYSVLGVSDRAARMPAAFDAALLVAAIYFFLRRFRPGSEIDASLIAASCAATIGFARAAATDMPLAATFTIAMLGWYAWHESEKRIYLAAFYAFIALGTLAKGPVAPFLAAVIVAFFAALKRDWRILFRSLWIPGIVVFLVIALPWYIAVQIRNPEFFRVFVVEHNLARFSQDVYHHRQPFWFYLPVALLSLVPWVACAITPIVARFRCAWSERWQAFSNDEDSWAWFLLIWLAVPVIFFSFSQSKLPGYILPAIPAGALLVADDLTGRREQARLPAWLASLHALICGVMMFGAIAAPQYLFRHRLAWDRGTMVAMVVALVTASVIGTMLLTSNGFRVIRVMTMLPVVLGVAAILRLASPVIDHTLSARPIAHAIQNMSEQQVPIAVFKVNRELQYGLEFYLNRGAARYEDHKVPPEGHLLVAGHDAVKLAVRAFAGRKVSLLTTVPAQNLDIYWIGPSPPQ